MSKCKFCGEEIEWSKADGKNIPMDQNGTRHDCRKPPQKKSQVDIRKIAGVLKKKIPETHNVLVFTQMGDATIYCASVWKDIEALQEGDRIEITYSEAGVANGVNKVSGEATKPVMETAKEILENNKAAARAATVQVFGVAKDLPPVDTIRIWNAERMSIGITINLDNFENIRIELEGPACNHEGIISDLDLILSKLGKNEVTRERIEAYKKRVIG
jgi:hypothetical protein